MTQGSTATRTGKTLADYYRRLKRHFGPQHWWPAETPFEVMVGAILTQNTAWANVTKAIKNLKALDLLDPHRLNAVDLSTLAVAIRPAGYFNVKAARLKNFVHWLVTRYDGHLDRLKKQEPQTLREELLSIKGIGQETADSMLLYALDIPTFVVDLYTYRILTRHQLIHSEATYEEMKELFEGNLRRDAKCFNEFHALCVAVGKNFCRPTPRCEKCPLQPCLPG